MKIPPQIPPETGVKYNPEYWKGKEAENKRINRILSKQAFDDMFKNPIKQLEMLMSKEELEKRSIEEELLNENPDFLMDK